MFLENLILFPSVEIKAGQKQFFPTPMMYNYEKKKKDSKGTDLLKAITGSNRCKSTKEFKIDFWVALTFLKFPSLQRNLKKFPVM